MGGVIGRVSGRKPQSPKAIEGLEVKPPTVGGKEVWGPDPPALGVFALFFFQALEGC